MEGVYINRQMGGCNRFVCPFLRPIRPTLLPTTKVYMKAAVNTGTRIACSHFIQSGERSTVLFFIFIICGQKKTRGCHICVNMSPPGARNKWQVASSNTALNTHNPIRSIVENLRLEPNPQKPMIALSIGEFMEPNLCSLLKHI